METYTVHSKFITMFKIGPIFVHEIVCTVWFQFMYGSWNN